MAYAEKMTYGASQQAPIENMNSVLKSITYNSDRLGNAVSRVRELADIICGAIPRPAHDGEAKGMVGLVNSLADHARADSDRLTDLHTELDRILDRLGIANDAPQVAGRIG